MHLIAVEKCFQGRGGINGGQSRHGGKLSCFCWARGLVASSGLWAGLTGYAVLISAYCGAPTCFRNAFKCPSDSSTVRVYISRPSSYVPDSIAVFKKCPAVWMASGSVITRPVRSLYSTHVGCGKAIQT